MSNLHACSEPPVEGRKTVRGHLHEGYDPEFVDEAVLFFVNRCPGDPMAEIARVRVLLSCIR